MKKTIILLSILFGSINSFAVNLNWNNGWAGQSCLSCEENFHKVGETCVPDSYTATFSPYNHAPVSDPCDGTVVGSRNIESCNRDHDSMIVNSSYCSDPQPTMDFYSPQGTITLINYVSNGDVLRTCDIGQTTGTDVVSCYTGFHEENGACVENFNPMQLVVDGSSGQVIIKVLPNTENDQLVVDWGDGNVETIPYRGDYIYQSNNPENHTYASGFAQDAISHTYAISGNYTVTISGNLKRNIATSNSLTNGKLIELKNWGQYQVISDLAYVFLGESKFTTLSATDWDLGNVTNMNQMFNSATVFNSPVNFNTQNVEFMSAMFNNARAFNQPINFNTAKVTNMRVMFNNAVAFASTVNFSDTSKVTNMSSIFANTKFNSPVNFNTSKVTDMSFMFQGNTVFNQDVNFNTAEVTTMQSMFSGASSFNKPVNFNTVKVTNMTSMFYNLPLFNQTINFNASSLTTAQSLLQYCPAFNSSVTLSNSSNLTNISFMFFNIGQSAFNSPLVISDTTKITTMSSMFNGLSVFNQNLSGMHFKSSVTRTSYDSNTPAWQSQNKPVFDLP